MSTKTMTFEECLEAFSITRASPIAATYAVVIDGEAVAGCLVGVYALARGWFDLPKAHGRIYSCPVRMLEEFGGEYIRGLISGFDRGLQGLGFAEDVGPDHGRDGYKLGHEVGAYIHKHGVVPLEVPDYAPEEALATA